MELSTPIVPEHGTVVDGGSIVEAAPAEPFAPAADDAPRVDPDLAAYTKLAPVHARELLDSAISPDVAAKHGVYTASSLEDLPVWAHWMHEQSGDAIFPVVVYPMLEPNGSETGQVKPQQNTVRDKDGEFVKYVGPAGDASPQLPLVRTKPDAARVLIVEGVKQALAADAYVPNDFAIHRICGVTAWLREGVPTNFLGELRGKEVFIAVDADAATKHAVYQGADDLGRAVLARRALSVRYFQVAGTGNAGLDDLLAREPDEESRRQLVEDWIATATKTPAPVKPKPPSAEERRQVEEAKARAAARAQSGRPLVHVGGDRQAVVSTLVDAVKRRFDGTKVFAFGGVLARLDCDSSGPIVTPMTEGDLMNVISRAAETVKGRPREQCAVGGCTCDNVWPERPTWQAMQAQHRLFTRLDGVASAPLVRHDGSLVTADGYDPATRMYLHLSEDIRGIAVPAHPTDDDVACARSLLLDDLLVDFPFKEQSDRANAVAALLTPLIRPSVPLVPLAVIDGLQAGIGKGYLLDAIAKIHTGRSPDLASLPETEEETRKAITATLAAGQTFVVFDEAHEVSGKNLARALTAQVWSDRRLGQSTQLRLENNACWYCAGNNVQVLGDMARRYYPIRLHTNDPDPQNRPAASFKHNIVEWVPANRRRLLEALLTLVRAWYSRGCPKAAQTFSFGSFEHWQKTVSGILATAGIEGFLSGLNESRIDSDFDAQHWEAHFGWLAEQFGVGINFTAKSVVENMATHPLVECPPGLESLPDTMDSRALGKAWAKHGARWRGGYRLRNAGVGGQNRTQWVIDRLTEGHTFEASGTADDRCRATVTLPFESNSARPMPAIDGPTIAEMSA